MIAGSEALQIRCFNGHGICSKRPACVNFGEAEMYPYLPNLTPPQPESDFRNVYFDDSTEMTRVITQSGHFSDC
jgi:hypothetical protein